MAIRKARFWEGEAPAEPCFSRGSGSAGASPSPFSTACYLLSQASSSYFIQVYFSDAADPSGYGEGQEYWGGFMAWTDENGVALFGAIVLPIGRNGYFTLTATDAWGNTSEFSNAFYVEIPPPP